MKRLLLIVVSTVISFHLLAQDEAFVVEQKNGLADIFKVTESIRVRNQKDSVYIVYGDSIGESYARADIKRIRFNEEKVLVDSVERAALVALYNATDGDNWINNINWCSDKPISEWYGVDKSFTFFGVNLFENNLNGSLPLELWNIRNLIYLNLAGKYDGNIIGEIPKEIGNLINLEQLFLNYNKLTGEIPKEIGNLINLKQLFLNNNKLTGEIPREFEKLTNLENLSLYVNYLNGEIPFYLGNLMNLTHLLLSNNEFSGEIPKEIGNLINLTHLLLGNNKLTGEIPKELGNLINLTHLSLGGWGSNLTGKIPKELGNLKNLTLLQLGRSNLSGEIPYELGSLTELEELYLEFNQLEGEIPESFNDIIRATPDFYMSSYYNKLSGKIPYMFIDRSDWYYRWSSIMVQNKYDLSEVYVPGPTFHVTDINGAILDSKDIYPNHKYTAIFHWATYCVYSMGFMPEVIRLYKKYKDFGFEVVGLTSYEELSTVSEYIEDNEIEWPNFFSTPSNMLDYIGTLGYPEGATPEITLIDPNGRVVFTSWINDRYELSAFLEDKLGEGKKDEYYTSTDYSQDGKVKTLQIATKGEKTIDIVLMGEGFVDKDMNNGGKYDLKMNEAMENFFAEQPFSALREYFNVYAVKAVSPNAEFFENSIHAINEDNSKAFEYAIKAVGENADRMMIGVVYNSEYAGRSVTYMYNGDGSFVAFMKESNPRVLNHEMGGHGFAQLLDEYVEPENNGKTLPDDMKALLDTYWEQYGVGANVDYHNNPSEVKWADFIADERYAEENLGLYEGSFLYTFGCYRPTSNSMMRYGDGPFNAPSREAIYKNVIKYSNPSWQYNREEFVIFDKQNFDYEKELSKKVIMRNEKDKKVGQEIENNLPPVIIDGGWKRKGDTVHE